MSLAEGDSGTVRRNEYYHLTKCSELHTSRYLIQYLGPFICAYGTCSPINIPDPISEELIELSWPLAFNRVFPHILPLYHT